MGWSTQMTQPLLIDIIGHIITYATIGTINVIARSCHACSALVRSQARDIADLWVTEHALGDAVSRRLPNGTLHGHMVSSPNGRLHMRWDRGQAMSWECQCFDDFIVDLNDVTPAMKRGHQGTPHVLSDQRHDVRHDHFIIVGDRVARTGGTIRIDVVTGRVRIGDDNIGDDNNGGNKAINARPPWALRGYLVDGEIVPGVINPWVDAILARVDTRAHEPKPTCVIGYSNPAEATRLINGSGMVIIKEV